MALASIVGELTVAGWAFIGLGIVMLIVAVTLGIRYKAYEVALVFVRAGTTSCFVGLAFSLVALLKS